MRLEVKELRGRSGAGILDAKKALTECEAGQERVSRLPTGAPRKALGSL